jgi:hypothetical protein
VHPPRSALPGGFVQRSNHRGAEAQRFFSTGRNRRTEATAHEAGTGTRFDELTHAVIGAAIEVHRWLASRRGFGVINFNTPCLRDGVRRVIWDPET